MLSACSRDRIRVVDLETVDGSAWPMFTLTECDVGLLGCAHLSLRHILGRKQFDRHAAFQIGGKEVRIANNVPDLHVNWEGDCILKRLLYSETVMWISSKRFSKFCCTEPMPHLVYLDPLTTSRIQPCVKNFVRQAYFSFFRQNFERKNFRRRINNFHRTSKKQKKNSRHKNFFTMRVNRA